MQQDDERSLAGLDVVQPLVAYLGVTLTKLGCTHCYLPGADREDAKDFVAEPSPWRTLVTSLVRVVGHPDKGPVDAPGPGRLTCDFYD